MLITLGYIIIELNILNALIISILNIRKIEKGAF